MPLAIYATLTNQHTVIPRSFVHNHSTVQFNFLDEFFINSLQIPYHHVQNMSCYLMVSKNTVLKFRKSLKSAKYHSRAICLNFLSIKTYHCTQFHPFYFICNITNGLEAVEMILLKVATHCDA